MANATCECLCYDLAECWLNCLEAEHKDDLPPFEYNSEARVRKLAKLLQASLDDYAETLEDLATGEKHEKA